MKNLLFFAILIISLLLARFIGETVLSNGTLQINPNLTTSLQNNLQTPSISIPSQTNTPPPSSTPQDLAQCLTTKGYIMYGTKECPNCALERSYFGPAFSIIKEVDCDDNPTECKAKNVTGYPTWIGPNGERFKGAVPLKTLAELTHCPIPG